MQLSLGFWHVKQPVAYRTTCINAPRRINQITMKTVRDQSFRAPAYHLCTLSILFLFFLFSPVGNPIRQHLYTLVCLMFARGFIAPRTTAIKVRTLFIVQFGTPNLALYALAPNHVFGQQLGCPAPVLATLRFTISAKVVKGELLRFCLGLSKGAPP